jgi:hypothetical protein
MPFRYSGFFLVLREKSPPRMGGMQGGALVSAEELGLCDRVLHVHGYDEIIAPILDFDASPEGGMI